MICIHFQKARFVVPVRYLGAYLRWSWVMALGGAVCKLRAMVYSVYSPWPMFTLDQEVASAISGCQALASCVGWIRYPTDGTRLQVFDHFGGKIYKMVKPLAGFASLEQELGWRAKVGDLAPQISEVCEHPPAYIEEWVEGRVGRYSVEELQRLILLLAERLYRVEWLEFNEYLQRTSTNYPAGAIARMAAAMCLVGWAKLPISPVHGDLVCQNIIFRDNGKPVILDWEYARICVVSHDLWFYLYHDTQKSHSGEGMPESFFVEMEHALVWIGLKVQNVRALHLFHLLEREALLLNNTSVVASPAALADIRNNIKCISGYLKIEN